MVFNDENEFFLHHCKPYYLMLLALLEGWNRILSEISEASLRSDEKGHFYTRNIAEDRELLM